MDTNEQDISYDFLDTFQVPWFDVNNAKKGVVLSFRHELTWNIAKLPGSDSPNASTDSLNWQVAQYMKHVLAGICQNTFIRLGNPNWVYWMLKEMRMVSSSVETDKELDFLCVDLSGEFWVERLKNFAMRFHYCLPTAETPLSQRLELLHRFFFRYCTNEGRNLDAETAAEDMSRREIVQSWLEANTTVDVVLFLPALCAMNYQGGVANAMSELGCELDCLFDEKIANASGFFVLSIKDTIKDSMDYNSSKQHLEGMAGILGEVEKSLRKVLMKHHSLDMYNRLNKCEKMLMTAPAIEPADAVHAIAQQMLGTSLGFFPENNYAMFKELIGRMGEITLAKITRGQGSREEARINLIRNALLKAANGVE